MDCQIKIVYGKPGGKPSVLIKEKFSAFDSYKTLKEKLIEKTNQGKFLSDGLGLKKDSYFILKLREGKKIGKIDCIFNKKTFEYLLKKISETNEKSLSFELEVVNEYPEVDLTENEEPAIQEYKSSDSLPKTDFSQPIQKTESDILSNSSESNKNEFSNKNLSSSITFRKSISSSGTFKIKVFYGEQRGKPQMILNSLFINYPKWKNLKDDIIERSKKGFYSSNGLTLEKDTYFILKLKDGRKIGVLEGIWNVKTYNYFLDKLKIEDGEPVINFDLKIVENLPDWTPPDMKDLFVKYLEEETEKANKFILSEASLMKLEEGEEKYNKSKNDIETLLKKGEKHNNVTCNKCFKSNFQGKRYMCTSCNNYNLCSECELKIREEQFHNKDHIFILINKKLDVNINEFRNIIVPKKIEVTNPEKEFKVEIKVANKGNKSLEKCYIIPIKYGDKILDCKKSVIDEELTPKKVKCLTLTVKMPDEYENGVYKGEFRMFTEHGLPFGDIISVTAMIGDKDLL